MLQATDKQMKAFEHLESAIRDENAASVDAALSEAYRAGFHPVHCQPLIALIDAPWHYQHENLAHAIQELRCPDAVATLERAAYSAYEYRNYDDYGMLASQCIWALADIGSPDAHAAIRRLANCGNPLIARSAIKRLDNWQKEQHRKAFNIQAG
jgi:HEAT repeat protein